MKKRRKILFALGTMPVLAALCRAQAQTPSSIRRIGILAAGSRDSTRYQFAAFDAGLRELGYVDGKNIMLEYRFADGKFDRLPSLAAELARRQPNVLLVQSTPAAAAAKAATTQIPIVMVSIADPVGAGLVSNLARPGGNITGITNITAELAGKRLAILKEIMPRLSRVAVIINPDDPNARLQMTNVEDAAKSLGIQLRPVLALRNADDLTGVFAAAVKVRAEAAIRMVDPLGALLRKRFVDLAAKHRLPVIYPFRDDTEAGGMISYGTNLTEQYRRAATYVDKILKGTKAGDLPVEQPTRFELVINGKTANALGLTIPQSLLVSADKVIE
jgi:putative tryptophan/tyrosine transport system substrate-binding protein